nr:hypothetical protein [Tanacetum cinerariifolium]
MNGWVDDDDDDDDDVEEEEVEENEDADMEERRDAEIIFPYEVQGDQTPLPRDEAGSQRPFAIRDFTIGVYEIGESFTARDPQFVGGLAPWALRRDLEALRRHERLREAESGTKSCHQKPMSEARICEIIRDQFATSMNEFMANMNSRAGGPGGASGSGGA